MPGEPKKIVSLKNKYYIKKNLLIPLTIAKQIRIMDIIPIDTLGGSKKLLKNNMYPVLNSDHVFIFAM